ncbi:UPF0147 family protein [Candidatus Woesearchaeota archaeon]|nr:UPF0147 family protein [Candidatus Woesearchaeota archaeon]
MNLQITEVVDNMKEIYEDNTIPKNVKLKLGVVIEILEENGDISMKISKAIHELEDLVEDKNLQAYSRTQLFNVISILETF